MEPLKFRSGITELTSLQIEEYVFEIRDHRNLTDRLLIFDPIASEIEDNVFFFKGFYLIKRGMYDFTT